MNYINTLPYSPQLARLYFGSNGYENDRLIHSIVEKIDAHPEHAFVLKNAAAVLHAKRDLDFVTRNMHTLRDELAGQLLACGIKDYQLGLRSCGQRH